MRPTNATLLVFAALVAGLPPAPAAALATPPAADEAIAFWTTRDGDREVHYATPVAAGTTLGSLSASPGSEDLDPSWSNDGTRIAFARRTPGSDFEIWSADAEGGGATRLTFNSTDDRQPDWSDDGARLAFVRATGPKGSSQIHTMSAGGASVTRITPEAAGRVDSSPAWSPGGTQIAYVSDRPGSFPRIVVVGTDGSGESLVTDGSCADGNPAWSADGLTLYFDRRCPGDGDSDLFSVDAAGLMAPVNVTDTPDRSEYDPDVSPDGSGLAFSANPAAGGNRDLWISDISGTGAAQVTNDAFSDLGPDWHRFPRPGGLPCDVLGTMGSDPALTGTAGSHVVCGLGGDDTLMGGPTASVLRGGGGADTADYGDAGGAVTANLATGTAMTGGDSDQLVGIEHLAGGPGADSLTGDAGNNTLEGRGGADTLDGAGGRDMASFDDPGVTQDVVASTVGATNDGFGNDEPSYTSIEDLRGSLRADTLTGSAVDNTLDGAGGNDTLLGLGGSDQLRGGPGLDSLNGGDGSDAADYRAAGGGVIANLGSGASSDGEGGQDTFVSLEIFYGSPFGDQVNGSGSSDQILGGDGDDVISGAGGDDLLRGGNGADRIAGGDGADRIQGEGEGDPRLDGGGGNDSVSGGAGADVIVGGSGADTLTGEGEADRLSGGPSGDVLRGGDGGDRLSGGDGNDLLQGGSSGDRLDGGKGKDRLYGEDGRDLLIGGRSGDRLNGGSGNDRLLGRDRVRDRLDGGNGRDTGRWDRRKDRVASVENGARRGIRVRRVGIAPGVTLTRYIDKRTPRRTFVLTVDPSKAPTMDVALAQDRLPGFERTSSMGSRVGALAAVNGDFGLPSGRPSFHFAEDGALRQSSDAFGYNVALSRDERQVFMNHPEASLVAIETPSGERWPVSRWNDGPPGLGELAAFTPSGSTLEEPPGRHCSARLAPGTMLQWGEGQVGIRSTATVEAVSCEQAPLTVGSGVVLSAHASSDEARLLTSLPMGAQVTLGWSLGWPGVLDSLGGTPMLMRDGAIVARACSESICGVHPRTGVAVAASGKIMLVVVDGRRKKWSRGLTLLGFAQEMERLGAVSALNLDGGGSSTLWIRGRGIVNRPSDGRERAVSSALLVLPGADPGDPAPLRDGVFAAPQQKPGAWTMTQEDRLAGQLAARDAGSTGGLAEAFATGRFLPEGVPFPEDLREALRIFRASR